MQLVLGGFGSRCIYHQLRTANNDCAPSTSSSSSSSTLTSHASYKLTSISLFGNTQIFFRLLTAVFLVVNCITMSGVQSSPVRNRRETVSSIVDMNRLRNPCGIAAGGESSSNDCSLGDPVRLTAKLAKDALAALQKHMGSNTCSGMSLDARVKMPEITETMSNEDKLREIFKSLVQHVAFMQAMSSRDTETAQSFESSLSKMQTLQCSMMCHLGLTSTQLDEMITSAGSIDVDTNQGASGQILRNCLVVDSALHLLDILLQVAQG